MAGCRGSANRGRDLAAVTITVDRLRTPRFCAARSHSHRGSDSAITHESSHPGGVASPENRTWVADRHRQVACAFHELFCSSLNINYTFSERPKSFRGDVVQRTARPTTVCR